MNKRLLKRNKRQTTRAKARVKLSEPDVRTPEQITAAKEASRPAGGWRNGPQALYPSHGTQGHSGQAAISSAKTDT